MDGSAAGPPRAWFATQRFDDADNFARALQGSGVEYVPMQPGRYVAQLTLIGFGGMVLQRASDRAHVTRGVIDRDTVALLLPLHQQAAPTVNGWHSDGSEGLLLAPGSALHALCPGDVDWAALTLPPETAWHLAELGGLGGAPDRPDATLRIPWQVIAPLQRAAIAATDAVAGHAPAPGLLEAITMSLTEHVSAAFALAEERAMPRATRAAIRLVGAAEALLHAMPARPLFTQDLCARLGVSPRSLHKAFVAATGTSPQVYLRRRRLMMVHAVLKDGGGDAGLVKSAALSHGFWHLGHFARAYREQFGQTPSETLALARVGSYRRAARRSGTA